MYTHTNTLFFLFLGGLVDFVGWNDGSRLGMECVFEVCRVLFLQIRYLIRLLICYCICSYVNE